jgi:hypothetical protein
VSTPRFAERLSGVSTGARRTPAPVVLGAVLAPLGVLLVFLAWLGASNTPLLQEQVSYLISGGLLGLGFIVLGGFCYFAYWQTEILREMRNQTAEITAALRAGQGPVSGTGGLVVTADGSLAHRPTCPVVRNRDDLQPAGPEVAPCVICDPTT